VAPVGGELVFSEAHWVIVYSTCCTESVRLGYVYDFKRV
jgi:hypothetical protein